MLPFGGARGTPAETASYDQLSQACSDGSGSNGLPPSYQPGALHISKWRWQPSAFPVSPTAPIVWPVYTRSPALNGEGWSRCM